MEQVTAVLDGKRMLGLPREIQEIRNAFAAYETMDNWHPASEADLLVAHGLLMSMLIDQPGVFRSGGVSIFRGEHLVHMAPPAAARRNATVYPKRPGAGCKRGVKREVWKVTALLYGRKLSLAVTGGFYQSILQLKCSVSQQHAIDPSAYERANYVQVLDSSARRG